MNNILDEAPIEIKTQLQKNQTSLKINRLPKYIRDIFIKTANEVYCDDYGMFLTVLVERYLKEELNGIRRD